MKRRKKVMVARAAILCGEKQDGMYIVVLTRPLSSHKTQAAAARAASAVKLQKMDKVIVIREASK